MNAAAADPVREQIDTVDRQIVELVRRRFQLVRDLKAASELPAADAYIPVLAARVRALCGPDTADDEIRQTVEVICRELLSREWALLKPLTVAFLGPEGTFTHQAAREHFGRGIRVLPLTAIADVFADVERGRADYGVVPVENSTYGVVSHTFDRFYETELQICAEINLAVHQHLLGNCRFDQVKVVYSHPQAIGQCRTWLQQHLPGCECIELGSTGLAAQRAAGEQHSAAIASSLAAESFGLKVLAENIQDLSENITRFLVLGREAPAPTGQDKTSLLLALEHRVGALHDVLSVFKAHQANLLLIESRPSRKQSWSYVFFLDFVGHISEPRIAALLEDLAGHCQTVKCLGSYPRG